MKCNQVGIKSFFSETEWTSLDITSNWGVKHRIKMRRKMLFFSRSMKFNGNPHRIIWYFPTIKFDSLVYEIQSRELVVWNVKIGLCLFERNFSSVVDDPQRSFFGLKEIKLRRIASHITFLIFKIQNNDFEIKFEFFDFKCCESKIFKNSRLKSLNIPAKFFIHFSSQVSWNRKIYLCKMKSQENNPMHIGSGLKKTWPVQFNYNYCNMDIQNWPSPN